MYATRGAWVESHRYRAAAAAEAAYWARTARGLAEPVKVHGASRAYAPEVEALAPGWGRLAWQKAAAEIEAKAGNPLAALPFDATDDDIRGQARMAASGLFARVLNAGTTTKEGAREVCEAACREWGIEPPAASVSDHGALARMMTSDWWLRRLRAAHGRRIEKAAISLCLVHQGAQCYVSNVTLARRQEQRARNQRALERAAVVNQFGDEFTLAELAEKSNANPRVRSAELLTRIRGFEIIAGDLGHVAEFWTMTAPSRFHAVKKCGKQNAKHDGSTPREAQEWLCLQWARFRAWAKRNGIEFYGFRVAEPHHDACPHWHFLLFMPADRADEARLRFHRFALVTQESERLRKLTKKQTRAAHPGMTWAKAAEAVAANHARADLLEVSDLDRVEHATKFVRIDPEEEGGAVGYIIKYISKNIDGYKLDRDLFGNEAVSASRRVEAWAANWRIRQFQQVGGAPVGVWREVRRLKAEDDLPDTVEAARAAADVGKNSGYGEAGQGWAEYLRIQGGATVARKDLALKVAYTREGERFDPVSGDTEPAENCYGEPAAPAVFGVLDVRRERVALSRRFKWKTVEGVANARNRAGGVRIGAGEIERGTHQAGRGTCAAVGGVGEVAPGRHGERSQGLRGSGLSKGEARAARTRVNNCTGGGDGSEGISGLVGSDFDHYRGGGLPPGGRFSGVDRGIGDESGHGPVTGRGSGGGGGGRARASGGGVGAFDRADDGGPGIVGAVGGARGDRARAVRDHG